MVNSYSHADAAADATVTMEDAADAKAATAAKTTTADAVAIKI